MLSIYSKNLSSHEAIHRSRAGLSRESNPRTNNISHPSLGGSQGYPLYLRRDILYWESRYGIDFVVDRFLVSKSSVYRWKNRIEPLQQTGNIEREILTGNDQLILSIGLFLYPRMSNDELATFISANGGAIGLSRQAISNRLKDLDVTRKRASLEAYAAYSPINRQRFLNFFYLPPPLGIRNVPLWRLIDFDEAKFCLTGAESKYGRSVACVRVRDTGHYVKMQRGINLVLAIESGNPYLPPHVYGSIQNPRKWWIMSVNNVNQIVFADFVDMVCTDIESNPVPGNYDNERYLMWDNLSAHMTGVVTVAAEMRLNPDHEFTIVPRPPYQPKVAPVEYIFCEIANRLTYLVKPNWTILDLRFAIETCLITIGRDCKLNRTFRHCLINQSPFK